MQGASTVSVSFWKMQFQSPKCKCWNLSQLSRQGYILGRFLLGFSQCNSRVPDWIPARCFEASLSQQNGFSSLIEPSSCLIWFLWKLLTYSTIISYKKEINLWFLSMFCFRDPLEDAVFWPQLLEEIPSPFWLKLSRFKPSWAGSLGNRTPRCSGFLR